MGRRFPNRLKQTFGNYIYALIQKSEEPEGNFIAEAVFDIVGYYKTIGDVADLSEAFSFASYLK